MKRLRGRVLGAIFLLWAVFTLTFFLSRFAPGNPFSGDRKLPPEIMSNLLAYYHLDRPLWAQYLEGLKHAVRGDFGVSFKNPGLSVNDMIGRALPVSLTLGGVALLESLVLAVFLGLAISLSGKRVSSFLRFFSTSLVALPSFLLATLLIAVFSSYLGLLPPALWEGWKSLLLPSLSISLAPAGYLARVFATSLEETMGSPFYQAARGHGIARGFLLVRHLVAPSLNGLLSILGPLAASLLTGSFVVESIFAIPGLGRVFVLSVMNRDYPMIMGTTMVYTVLLALMTLLGDWLVEKIDPRIRAI
ncbi:MAG: ABC transporter permease [Nitrospiraceae bacterium]|jgi:ABC-type dipeptide/oligopeptide/nickel transport system permease component|nr:ABC transporter permease [Nitrospiraceae bacterium]